MPSTPRHTERRQVNSSTDQERRGTGQERRRCPDCQAPLKTETRPLAGGSVITMTCAKCGWTKSSRQTDASVLLAKLTWALPLEKKGGAWNASFPAELADSLKLKTAFQHIGILSLEFHVDKLSRPLL